MKYFIIALGIIISVSLISLRHYCLIVDRNHKGFHNTCMLHPDYNVIEDVNEIKNKHKDINVKGNFDSGNRNTNISNNISTQGGLIEIGKKAEISSSASTNNSSDDHETNQKQNKNNDLDESDIKSRLINARNGIKAYHIRYADHKNYCLINIHGFPHSGTGIMSLAVIKSFPAGHVAYFQHPMYYLLNVLHKSNKTENFHIVGEGVINQDLYPRTRGRSNSVCNKITKPTRHFDPYAIHFFCPDLMDPSYITEMKKEYIWIQWSKYWRPDRPLLVQKSPTFDAVFLSKLFPQALNVFVMRHPMFFSAIYAFCSGLITDIVNCPILWVQSWRLVLIQISKGLIPNYFFGYYEDLIENGNVAQNEIHGFVEKRCKTYNPNFIYSSTERRFITKGPEHKRRKLHIRKKGAIDQSLMWSNTTMMPWLEILKDPKHRKVLEALEPAARFFGYSLIDVDNRIVFDNKDGNSDENTFSFLSSDKTWDTNKITKALEIMTLSMNNAFDYIPRTMMKNIYKSIYDY